MDLFIPEEILWAIIARIISLIVLYYIIKFAIKNAFREIDEKKARDSTPPNVTQNLHEDGRG